MKLFPAIDLYDHKAVRLYKGRYEEMTVYSEDPLAVARTFVAAGATCLHLVDLAGARDGTTPHLDLVTRIANETPLFVEIGGGIRTMDTARAYLDGGVDRVILGTAAVTDQAFLVEALATFGAERIAVGVDIKDGFVAIKGWRENSAVDAFDFCRQMTDLGVRYIICTDISKDGAMQGTNRTLYSELSARFPTLSITASGGVSDMDDIRALRAQNLYAAIIGKAYYIGAIDLREALEVAK